MKKNICLGILVFFLLLPWKTGRSETRDEPLQAIQNTLLIDDFASEERAAMGGKWTMFTDRVMGGLSDATAGYEILDGRSCLRLSGYVSLANNGGFIQIALPLEKSGSPFDASEYTGVRIAAKGNGEEYALHLRTNETRQPWQYYGASFGTSGEWQTIEVSFASFHPENLTAELNTKALLRIAVVAIKKEFKADIAVARLEFYK